MRQRRHSELVCVERSKLPGYIGYHSVIVATSSSTDALPLRCVATVTTFNRVATSARPIFLLARWLRTRAC